MGFLISSTITLWTNLEIDEIRGLEDDRRNKKIAYQMRKGVLRWLSPGDFEETHERHFKKRFENTGQWLLDDPRFGVWRDETQSSILWCHGARKSSLYICLCAYINTY